MCHLREGMCHLREGMCHLREAKPRPHLRPRVVARVVRRAQDHVRLVAAERSRAAEQDGAAEAPPGRDLCRIRQESMRHIREPLQVDTCAVLACGGQEVEGGGGDGGG
eukprot:7381765-Prymnesium_polylepis.1